MNSHYMTMVLPYGGKVEFGKSSMICQTNPFNLVLTINNLLTDLLICQTFLLYSTVSSSGLFITKNTAV